MRLNRPQDWRPFASGRFPTRSGKVELYSEPLKELGHDPLPAAGDIPTGPCKPVADFLRNLVPVRALA